MTKYIKRVGIVFFAIVLSLLLFIGIILTLNATNSNENFSDLENDDIQTVADKQYDLPGDFNGNMDTWNDAIRYSVNNDVWVMVKLLSDWKASSSNDSMASVYGYGNGFLDGGIWIPMQSKVMLDMNGYSLIGAYNMKKNIVINGRLSIIDNSIKNKDYKNEVLSGNISGSKITGFTILNNEPLIRVSGAYAYFDLHSSYITGNSFQNSSSVTSYGFVTIEGGTAHFYKGAICNNSIQGSVSSNQRISAVKGECNLYEIVIVEKNSGMGGIDSDGAHISVSDGNTGGYIYGSNKYDIYLDGGSEIIINDFLRNGTYGIAVTPWQVFTREYTQYWDERRNPVQWFKFRNPSITGEYYAVVDKRTDELKFVEKYEMSFIEKPTRGTSTDYTIEYGQWYYPVGYTDLSMTISDNHLTGIGKHTAKVEPKSGYLWAETNEFEIISFEFQVVPKKLAKPALGTSTFVYDGQAKSPTLQNYDTSSMTKSGTDSSTNVGSYTINISLLNTTNYRWQDNTTTPITLNWSITEKPIEKPVTGNNIYIFNNSAYEYVPEGFESSQMTISDNIQTNVGKYTAKVKPNSNHKWSDDTKTELEFDYKIIPPGIVVEDNLNWDYLYLQNNFRKSYSANNYYHKVNDEDIVNVSGNIRYVLGNIVTGTKISTFLGNIRNDIKLIKIYNQYDNIIYDGIASNGEIAESVGKQLIATGYRVELYENATETTAFDTVYLSVLGDLNGDGRITAMDLLVINQMAKDESLLDSMDIEYQLAAMVNNKGGITSVDSEILNNVMSGELDLNLFINAEINENTNYTYLILNKENGKYERVVSETATNVIGNITIGTKVSEFKAKLATLGVNTAQIAIYNNQDTQVTDDNAVVGTGWYYEINGGQKTYISVLGDLNGDGRISASDMMYLNELMSSDLNNAEDYIIISALILNTGNITSADRAVLEAVFENTNTINNY